MQPADWRVSGDSDAFGGAEVFALSGEVYAIYLPEALGSEILNTGRVEGRFGQRWFDPRTGQMINGSDNLIAGDALALGAPPYAIGDDWVILVSRLDQPVVPVQGPQSTQVSSGSNSAPRFESIPRPAVSAGEHFSIVLTATDAEGTFPSVTVGVLPPGMRINGPGNGQLELSWTVPATASAESIVELIAIDALDSSLRTTEQMVITVGGASASQAQNTATELPAIGSTASSYTSGTLTATPPSSGATPVFQPMAARQVRAGELLEIRVQAEDADGFPPSLVAVNAPAQASFDDNGDGTRTLRWQTRASDAGQRTITFLARDHALPSLSATLNVEIQITP
jgi:hypothetical protein